MTTMRVTQERIHHPDQSFRFLRFSVDAFRGEMHRHPQLELTWIERGSGLRYVGDSAMPFKADDLVLVGANVPHWWVSSREGESGRPTATVVQFPVTLITDAAFPELRAVRTLVEQARFGLKVVGACRAALVPVLQRMRKADPIGRLSALVEILGLLNAHPRSLRRLAGSPSRIEDRKAGERRIDRVVDWIHNRLDQPLRVADAAKIAHVSSAAFSRFFSREVGKTFTRYLNDVRCSEACVRLAQSDKPISLVAGECGFTSMAHFNRQFRLRMHTTPRDYRLSTTRVRK
jgi:AraC-like DNA-binding protein